MLLTSPVLEQNLSEVLAPQLPGHCQRRAAHVVTLVHHAPQTRQVFEQMWEVLHAFCRFLSEYYCAFKSCICCTGCVVIFFREKDEVSSFASGRAKVRNDEQR
jgi:hypothetical protein